MTVNQARGFSITLLAIAFLLGARVSLVVVSGLAVVMSLYDMRKGKEESFQESFWFYLLLISFLAIGLALIQINPDVASNW